MQICIFVIQLICVEKINNFFLLFVTCMTTEQKLRSLECIPSNFVDTFLVKNEIVLENVSGMLSIFRKATYYRFDCCGTFWKPTTVTSIKQRIIDRSELKMTCLASQQCNAYIIIPSGGLQETHDFREDKQECHLLFSGSVRIYGQHTCSVWKNVTSPLLLYMQTLVLALINVVYLI